MASLYIKSEKTADRVAQLAERLGLSKTATVDRALDEMAANLDRDERDTPERRTAREKLIDFWDGDPLPPPTGLKADKAFFDRLWGEE